MLISFCQSPMKLGTKVDRLKRSARPFYMYLCQSYLHLDTIDTSKLQSAPWTKLWNSTSRAINLTARETWGFKNWKGIIAYDVKYTKRIFKNEYFMHRITSSCLEWNR
jgi:hypothetical protein